jgi:hypothetical protein
MLVVLSDEGSRMRHLTPDEIERLAAGRAPFAELAETAAHVRDCARCAALVAGSQAVRQMAGDVRTQIDAGEPAIVYRPRAPRVSLRWILPIAATLAALAVAAWLLAGRRAPLPPQTTTAQARRPLPPPTPTPTPGPRKELATTYGHAKWDALVRDALSTRTLAMPAVVQALRASEASFRGEGELDERSLVPDGTVVRETRPSFAWHGAKDARYTVILGLPGDQVIASDPVTETRWRPPFDLQRGREYAWQLEVASGESRITYPRAPRAPARFRVLGAAENAEIEEAARRFPDDHLLQAVLLAAYGVREEAERKLARYRERGDPAVADALLRSLGAW